MTTSEDRIGVGSEAYRAGAAVAAVFADGLLEPHHRACRARTEAEERALSGSGYSLADSATFTRRMAALPRPS